MKIWFAAILGLVQGIAEFLPISSSGHLAVLQNLFDMENVEQNHMFFTVLLHLGTLISVCFVYRHEIMDMISEGVGFIRDLRHPSPDEGRPRPARRLLLMIIIATLPLFVVLPFSGAIEKLSSSSLFIGIAFLITGAMLFIADKFQQGRTTEKTMSPVSALIIGACQAIAVLPGISRSGATITSGMVLGLNRNFAVKFAFLLSIPAVLGANIISLFKAIGAGFDTALLPAYLVGMLVAMVSGYFAISLVKMLSQKGKFGKFCYYCFGVGILTIVLSIII
ncbi:MAG: undecaprenyl-diphosphate phosphatase [Oscillospiraceae bacterium]